LKILKQTIESYEETYRQGYDKSYPSIELVRIENFFLKEKGHVLDFGCGPGTNGIHFLKNDHNVTFCDISGHALKKVKEKIKKEKIKKKFKLINLVTNQDFFKKNIDTFDYIICLSVLNNFKDKKAAKFYLNQFHKLLKKNGKLIIDSNLRDNHNYKVVNKKKNIYTTNPKNNFNLRMFFPQKKEFILMVKKSGFKIDDIGYLNFKIFNSFEKELIISATKL
jgi:cyclopropane fatty-acyl-phospholipid synthase-like methyltransferase